MRLAKKYNKNYQSKISVKENPLIFEANIILFHTPFATKFSKKMMNHTLDS